MVRSLIQFVSKYACSEREEEGEYGEQRAPPAARRPRRARAARQQRRLDHRRATRCGQRKCLG